MSLFENWASNHVETVRADVLRAFDDDLTSRETRAQAMEFFPGSGEDGEIALAVIRAYGIGIARGIKLAEEAAS